MMEKFQRLNHRQQIGLVVAAHLVLAVVLYLSIWQPLNSALTREKREYDLAVQAVGSVESYARQIIQLQQASGESSQVINLTALVNESLQIRRLEFTRLQQISAEQVQVRMDSIDFGDALAWLYDLESTPGLVIGDLSVRPSGPDQPGRVNMTIGLNRLN